MQSRETLLPPCDAVPAQAGSKGARCCKDAMHTEPRSNHEAAPSAHLCRPVPRGPAPDSPRADTATECQALLLARRCSEAAHPLPPHQGCGIKFACIVPGHRRVCAPFPTAHILASATHLGTREGDKERDPYLSWWVSLAWSTARSCAPGACGVNLARSHSPVYSACARP